MRRKDILVPFREVFGEFLTQRGYIFNRNCFVKYNNSVISFIGVYSRKHVDTVDVDIILYSEDISHVFLDDLTMENEDCGYRLSQIAYIKNNDGVDAPNYWEYELQNQNEPRHTLSKMLDVMKECFDTYFDPVDLDDLNNKRKRFDNELFNTDPNELLWDAFTYTPNNDFGISLNETIEKYQDLFAETLTQLKHLYFVFGERVYHEGFEDIEYLKKECEFFTESRELLEAFVNDDTERVSQIAEARKHEKNAEIKKNTDNNKALLKKYSLL